MVPDNDTGDARYQLTQIGGLISGDTVGALAVQSWELVAHLTDEVEYLWIGKFNFIKALYFCSRYVFLAAQIVNQLLSYGIAIQMAKMGNCSAIFIFKSVLGHASLSMLELILFIRVYALYRRHPKVKYLLGTVYISASSLEIAGNGFVIRGLIQTKGCHPPRTDKIALAMFGSGAGLYQLVIFALSLYKLIYDRRLSKTPLTSLMAREGVIVFVVLIAIMLVLLTHELVRNIDLAFARAAFSCFLATISMSASSLILNMRKLAVKTTRRIAQHSVGARNMAEGGAEGYYNTDQSICLTSFYE